MGSKDHPIENPCFVIKNWQRDTVANLKINGINISSESDLRQGIITDTDGTEILVVCTRLFAASPTEFHLN